METGTRDMILVPCKSLIIMDRHWNQTYDTGTLQVMDYYRHKLEPEIYETKSYFCMGNHLVINHLRIAWKEVFNS